MHLEPYHTGILVDDVAAAIPAWEAATGVPWGPTYTGPLLVRTPADDRTDVLELSMAYSTDLRLELVRHQVGTCWDLAGAAGIHHTGCWSNQLEADAATLEAQGWPIVAHGVGEAGEFAVFSYHQVPGLGLLELVSSDTREMLEALVRGG